MQLLLDCFYPLKSEVPDLILYLIKRKMEEECLGLIQPCYILSKYAECVKSPGSLVFSTNEVNRGHVHVGT